MNRPAARQSADVAPATGSCRQPDYPGDVALISALLDGDETAFETLIVRHHTSLIRLARIWVRDAPAAEEVAQETWMAVVQGIHTFEGRASLQSWIFGILANKAKRAGAREGRSQPFAAYRTDVDWGESREIGPEHFYPPGHEGSGHWTYPLADVESSPERHLLAEEAGELMLREIQALPAHYRSVLLLRDVHGFGSEETCLTLGISAANQRVLLHRARTRLRTSLEPYLREGDTRVEQHG